MTHDDAAKDRCICGTVLPDDWRDAFCPKCVARREEYNRRNAESGGKLGPPAPPRPRKDRPVA